MASWLDRWVEKRMPDAELRNNARTAMMAAAVSWSLAVVFFAFFLAIGEATGAAIVVALFVGLGFFNWSAAAVWRELLHVRQAGAAGVEEEAERGEPAGPGGRDESVMSAP